MGESSTKASSLRWQILRRSFLDRPPEDRSDIDIKLISRKATHGYNLIPYNLVENVQKSNPSECSSSRDVCLCYTVPTTGSPKLHLYQRVDNSTDLKDFEICNKYNIDNTGLVCSWPSEDVLAYYCLINADIFSTKKVIELGSGYGLAGLVIAAFTEASEVVISDGNPQAVDYIQRNINSNAGLFGHKLVSGTTLHWDDRETTSDYSNKFDLIVASDCTFFKDFHTGLAQTIKLLLKKDVPSKALLLSPKRGDSLEKILVEIAKFGLHCSVTDIYNTDIWNCHQQFVNGNDEWPNYEKDHCYPLLVTITL